MPDNTLTEDKLCAKFISALHEDKDRIEDIVFDDMMKSKSFVMNMIPDGGVVNYNDNNDTIEYTAARQAFRQYREQNADPKALVEGQVPGRDCNGRTGLFDADVNDVDPNACHGSCLFKFGQGYKIYKTKDYELPMSTPEVCARDYIRMGRAHVDGYFRGLFKQYREYGMDNFEANLQNLVIANGEANMSIIAANHFEVSKGGFIAPPEGCLSIHHLQMYRKYMEIEGGLDINGYLEINATREDWQRAVLEDQARRYGQSGQTSFDTMFFDDTYGNLQGREFHVYGGIRCVFDERPVRGYFKPAGTSGGEQLYDFVRVYHWKNVPNEDGGLSAEPNHDYYNQVVTCDGIDYDMCTLAFVVNRKSFKRYGLGAAKKYAGGKPTAQTWTMEVRDGAYLPCNDYNDKFKLVSRHAFRFKVEKAELSGAIAYRHCVNDGYLLTPTNISVDTVTQSFASPENYEKCAAGTCDKSNCACEGEIADDNGTCVAEGTDSLVYLEPCAVATTVFYGDAYAIELEVVRDGNTVGEITVEYATADGTATAGTDYTDTSGTITFADGEGGSKAITIPILDATAATNTFTVTLSNATGDATLGDCVVTTVTIEDGQ